MLILFLDLSLNLISIHYFQWTRLRSYEMLLKLLIYLVLVILDIYGKDNKKNHILWSSNLFFLQQISILIYAFSYCTIYNYDGQINFYNISYFLYWCRKNDIKFNIDHLLVIFHNMTILIILLLLAKIIILVYLQPKHREGTFPPLNIDMYLVKCLK